MPDETLLLCYWLALIWHVCLLPILSSLSLLDSDRWDQRGLKGISAATIIACSLCLRLPYDKGVAALSCCISSCFIWMRSCFPCQVKCFTSPLQNSCLMSKWLLMLVCFFWQYNVLQKSFLRGPVWWIPAPESVHCLDSTWWSEVVEVQSF